jgi:hypothetical protein
MANFDGNETVIEEEELDLLMSQVNDADVSRLVEEEEEENRCNRKSRGIGEESRKKAAESDKEKSARERMEEEK